MEMGIEHEVWRLGRQPGQRADEQSSPDWQGLRARFAAALAARRALGAPASQRDDSAPVGSFDRACARLLDTYEQALSDVNRTGLSNGKLGRGNDVCVAGALQTGGRG